MKIGVITLFGDNYGNKLQNLAVQTLLEGFGAEVQTIVVKKCFGVKKPFELREEIKKLNPIYVCKVANNRFKNKVFYKNQSDGIIKSIIFKRRENVLELQTKRRDKFRGFTEKHLKIADFTLSVTNVEDYDLDSFDFFIAGSDQVWNPTQPEPSSLYFLSFAPQYKRIALSPSFGVSKIPQYEKEVFAKRINEIPHLSVREEQGAKIIKELTGREATVLSDPTMCVSKEDWDAIIEKPDFIDGQDYVLTYFLGNETNKYRRYIENYAKKNNLKVIDVYDLRKPQYYCVDPAEFLYLIKNAKAVFTDSFHGSVFSIIFETPFVVFDRISDGGNSMGSRLQTLLKTFGFQDRKFPVQNDKLLDIDFSTTQQTLAIQKKKMTEFLQNAFKAEKPQEQEKLGVLDNKKDCCGCGACFNACPKQCITMQKDEEGFLYPVIDKEKCIDCGLCKKVCPVLRKTETSEKAKAYVGYNSNKVERKNSSSGGIFNVLASEIISLGGYVYGAGFKDDFSVAHYGVNSSEELYKLQTSKYVQSNTEKCYPKIKEQLDKGELVYFSGTPCQVEGLKSYLGKEYENLYTQDIICHGVPSPEVWKSYLELIGGKPKNVSFRDKTHGWHYFSMKIKTNKRKHLKRLDQDVYTRLFLDNTILRPSCYACHFKKENRISDFTLADCWDLSLVDNLLKDDDKGISLFFANTEKAQKLIERIKDKAVIKEVDCARAKASQKVMVTSVKMPESRPVFFETASVKGFKETIRIWYNPNPISNFKKTLIYYKSKIRRIIKRG